MYNEENDNTTNIMNELIQEENIQNTHQTWQVLNEQQYSFGDNMSEEKNIISINEWLSCFLVISIPLFGIIMMFVWAFGKGTEKNKANFLKAALIWNAVWIIVTIFFGLVIVKSIYV